MFKSGAAPLDPSDPEQVALRGTAGLQKGLSFVAFWLQLALTLAAAGVLVFSVAFTNPVGGGCAPRGVEGGGRWAGGGGARGRRGRLGSGESVREVKGRAEEAADVHACASAHGPGKRGGGWGAGAGGGARKKGPWVDQRLWLSLR